MQRARSAERPLAHYSKQGPLTCKFRPLPRRCSELVAGVHSHIGAHGERRAKPPNEAKTEDLRHNDIVLWMLCRFCPYSVWAWLDSTVTQ